MERKTRRIFLKKSLKIATSISIVPDLSLDRYTNNPEGRFLMTVKGKINSLETGYTLSHEHILVDFIGAEQYDPGRWNRDDVLTVLEPYLEEIMEYGCRTLVECTPAYIGRDPLLLKMISDKTGLNILTNTGFYGAADNKYLPGEVYSLKAPELAGIWIREFGSGIENTGIRPGFVKIGVAPIRLSELHKKIVRAAGITHLKTGLTIASHTGPAVPAFEQIKILKAMGVRPEAFIWVHAQNENNASERLKAARSGAWVSIDGVNENNVPQYIAWLKEFRKTGLLKKVLVSQDAGWYSPGKPNGGDFMPYSTVFKKLIPGLKGTGFTQDDIEQVFIKNPFNAYSIAVRKS